MATESAPLSRAELYYEPTGGEPVSVTNALTVSPLLPLISVWTTSHEAP